jgi:hypothetical protein
LELLPVYLPPSALTILGIILAVHGNENKENPSIAVLDPRPPVNNPTRLSNSLWDSSSMTPRKYSHQGKNGVMQLIPVLGISKKAIIIPLDKWPLDMLLYYLVQIGKSTDDFKNAQYPFSTNFVPMLRVGTR